MKRLLTLAAMFLCCMATSFAQYSGSGSGTESDPYLILNPIQLNQLRNFLNQSGVYFKLMADIDLTEFLEEENPSQGWQPVGKSSSAIFKGSLDGNNHTISGLWIKRDSTDYVGFFGYTSGAIIKNLKIVSTTIIGKKNVGGMSGYAYRSSISNCIFEGNVNGILNVGGYIGNSSSTTVSDVSIIGNVQGTNDYVGGIIGTGKTNNIINCKVTGNQVSGGNYVGGICGYGGHGQQLSNCYVSTNIYGEDYVGGLTGLGGYNYYINDSGFCGIIEGMSFVGGIIGEGDSNDLPVSVNKCFSFGTIKAKGDNVGGIIGHGTSYFPQDISNNYFSGKIVGRIGVGGICGKGAVDIINCFSHGQIVGLNNVGGLVGELYRSGSTLNRGSINKSVAINTRVTATDSIVGRIVGNNDRSGSIGAMGTAYENKSYNRTIVIDKGVSQEVEDDELNGTGVSATTLKLKATYVAMGWDFNDIWEILETECYPYFKTQTAPPIITSQVVSGATTISGKCVDGGTIILEIDGVKQQIVSSGNNFSFNVSPLQAGHEVRISAKADGKEQSKYTTEVVSFLGKGTEADPYQVYTAADLTCVYQKGYYKLMNNIDLSSYINQYCGSEGWESIGREGSETIHFDGDGHKVTGLWCNSTRDNTGLFSCFANGYIKNLTVETAKGKQVKGGNYTGIIIGKLINGEMIDCKAFGAVANGTPVGGMIGKLDGGKLLRCQVNVTINVTGDTLYVGGLAGEVTGDVEECLSNGMLTATGIGSYVGGLIGLNNSNSIVTNCYSNAVTNSSLCAAGLVAYNYGVVDKCYATGNIFSKNYGAGVIGYNDGGNAIVRNCVATSNKIDVTYESQSAQEGGYGQRIIGGIKNNAPAPELNNYALKTMQVSVNNVAQKVYDDIMNGVAKTGSELIKMATYQNLGWDFTDTWIISEDESYPALKNNIASVATGDHSGEEAAGANTLLGNDLQTSAGTKAMLSIVLTNEDEVKLCQFDLQLPTGVTVAKKSNGKLDATLTERAESHSVTGKQLDNGDYRFVISSMDNESFTGNNGTLLEIKLDVSATMEAGEYTVKVLNTELSVTNGNDLKVVKPADTKSKLIVKNNRPGDVNNDGSVSVTDVGCAINYILEQIPSVFIFDAADMNGDKDISVTDVGMIINLILNDGAASRQKTQKNVVDAHLSLMPISGGYQLMLENRDAFVAFQMDIQLANGATINDMHLNDNNDHQLIYCMLNNGKYRVICYSHTNSTFTDNDVALLNISTTGDINISDIRLTTAGLTELRPTVSNGMPTDIANVEQGIQVNINGNTLQIISDSDTTIRLYSLGGSVCRILNVHRGVNNFDGLRAGVYMIGNRKVILK